MKAFPVTALFLALLVAASHHGGVMSAAAADTKVTPGELVVDPPTLINLGFEWLIDGDANRNASGRGLVPASRAKRQWQHGHAAAAAAGRADLQAELVASRLAEHVCRQHPRPPAGHRLRSAVRAHRSGRHRRPRGRRHKTVTVRTRPEPMPYAGGSVYHVYPAALQGRRSTSRHSTGSCAPTTTSAAAATRRRRRGRG